MTKRSILHRLHGLAIVALLALGHAAAAAAATGASTLAQAPADPRAVTVHGVGDGRSDDSAAIQAAIDAAAARPGGGIVFVPSGRYRLTRTITIWPGVRVFGVGATRPLFLLADRTPGFARGLATMVMFAGARPGDTRHVPFPPPDHVPFDATIADANSGTFYSALSNVDFRIGAGNPAAIGVRFHAAQHAFLSHIDFDLGSALAGIYQVGNLIQDVHVHGGRYGILTEKPSPAWQVTIADSSFAGQRDAAIREHEAGLTLVNVAIADTPVGIDIDRGYGDWLWAKDVRFARVARAAIVIGSERNAYTQIGFENALANDTPVFARFRDSARIVAGKGARYRVANFTHGLTLPALGTMGKTETSVTAAPIDLPPAPAAAAIRALPPVADWANARDLGARGDERADDTAALQRAIDTHRVVYLPAGFYRVTETLRLRADSVLIGLHPGMTQIVLADETPGFQGIGPAKALVEAPRGGSTIVSGIGLATRGINPRATALLWKAGAYSLVEDVKFQGGHGTDLADGTRFDPYNADHTGDADPRKRWDAQYPSLWVTDGGGGTFVNLWSPSTYAQAGMLVSHTRTPGHVYEMSIEHHVRREFALDTVENWEFLAPQTEEEAGESGEALSFDIRNSRNILIANYHAYRVARSRRPARAAIRLENSTDIRLRNVHVNAESGLPSCDGATCSTFLRASKYPYENAIVDVTRGLETREREFAALDIVGAPVPAAATATPSGAAMKLADGFHSASGAAVDAAGQLYFVDHARQTIYRWTAAGGLAVVSDAAPDPVNLGVDRSGKLLVSSSSGAQGSAYSLDPQAPGAPIVPIAPTPWRDGRAATVLLPGNWWNNGEFRDQIDPATYRYPTLADLFAREAATRKSMAYVSPDGSLILPAFRTVNQGPPDHRGWRFSDALDAYGFVRAAAIGSVVYVSNGSEDRTYRGRLGAGGTIVDLAPFAERGGESVAVGVDGRVYVANGQVFVYDGAGREVDRIDVPDRPIQLIFGGTDGRTLYVLTHHALYSVRR